MAILKYVLTHFGNTAATQILPVCVMLARETEINGSCGVNVQKNSFSIIFIQSKIKKITIVFFPQNILRKRDGF